MDPSEFANRLGAELSWDESGISNVVSDLYGEHLLHLVGEALRALQSQDSGMAAALKLMIDSSDEDKIRGAIRHPYVASVLLHNEKFQDPYWRSLLLVEMGRLLNHSIGGPSLQRKCFEIRSGGCNLLTSLNISVDDRLPIPIMERGGNKIELIPEEARPQLASKTQAALDAIVCNVRAFDLFKISTEVLSFRREAEFPTHFSSGSFRELPGLSLILNAEFIAVTALEFADAMVHEAIHAVIYKYEALGCWVVRNPPPSHQRVASPWTGARLTVDSFAQACFVWFGLRNFWKGAVGVPHSTYFFDRAANGFKSTAYLERCRECQEFLAPGILDVLIGLPDRL